MARVLVRNLTKLFETPAGPLKILDSISFSIAEGEFVCLLGPSGSGKSVTLNCVAGLIAATSGSVEVDGVPVSREQPSCGYVFQQPSLLPWRTVEENLRFALRARSGRALPGEETKIRQVLELVSLQDYRHFYPHQISGGMQQRVGIARAYVGNPGLLLMDEPFSSLDEITARRLRADLVQVWMRDRRSVVFVTHDIIEACYLADRILVYTPKPTRIAAELQVALPRPRQYGNDDLYKVEKKVLEVFDHSLHSFLAANPSVESSGPWMRKER
jgi:ABC-type nitrate/sulfonate/bicarbonate transport system ATPase subunit